MYSFMYFGSIALFGNTQLYRLEIEIEGCLQLPNNFAQKK